MIAAPRPPENMNDSPLLRRGRCVGIVQAARKVCRGPVPQQGQRNGEGGRPDGQRLVAPSLPERYVLVEVPLLRSEPAYEDDSWLSGAPGCSWRPVCSGCV